MWEAIPSEPILARLRQYRWTGRPGHGLVALWHAYIASYYLNLPHTNAPPPPDAGEGQQKRAAEQFLGITMEDAALMPEQEFREVWQALGTMFRHRAIRERADQPQPGGDEQGGELDNQDEIEGQGE